MSPGRAQGVLVVLASLAVGLILSVFPLPDWAQEFRPQWPLLVLIYWNMAVPSRVNVFSGWLTGLLLDVMTGTLLGQHALGYAVVAYVVSAQHRRLRLFPLWQQTLFVAGMLMLERALTYTVAGVVGELPDARFWIAPAVGLVLWPWVFVIMRDIRRKFRVR
ncbi:MAG: rod shape-determining protein MreD [Pseudomonadota bacterium]